MDGDAREDAAAPAIAIDVDCRRLLTRGRESARILIRRWTHGESGGFHVFRQKRSGPLQTIE
jgi:hypothetical protein